MARKKKTVTVKKKSKNAKVSITIKILERAVKVGTRNLAEEAISLLGYTVTEKEGWVVKEYSDGRIERVSRIHQSKRSSTLVLD